MAKRSFFFRDRKIGRGAKGPIVRTIEKLLNDMIFGLVLFIFTFDQRLKFLSKWAGENQYLRENLLDRAIVEEN